MLDKKSKNKKYSGLGWLGAGAAAAGTLLGARLLGGRLIKEVLKLFMTEPYRENLWEVFSAGSRSTAQVIVENSLRAKKGKEVKRPLGGPKKYLDFSSIMFNVAQLHNLPTPETEPVDTSVVLGGGAGRPLRLDIPIMVAGMAYGFALSARAKIALARGTALAGTATNTGHGPYLPAERKAARHLVVQYTRGNWPKRKEVLTRADMVEIEFGHGARTSQGRIHPQRELDKEVLKLLGLKPGQDAILHNRMPGVTTPEDLAKLINRLRKMTGGVPIGVKIAAGNDLERDLAFILAAGADVITVDGAQGGSSSSAPTLQDDFGLPTLYALCRAVKYLEQKKARDKVSLVISGGLKTPGDYLKALALGADAVSIGTTALFAMTHDQVLKALPFEPPIAVVFQKGKYKDKLNVNKAAQNLANYLQSTTREMQSAARAVGKKSLRELNKNDLFALNQETADITGLALAYTPGKN